MACTYFRVLFLACDGRRRGDPNASRRDEVRIGRGLPSVKIYIHPAETNRLLKFLFHIMGRLVPAHNKDANRLAVLTVL